MDDSILKFLGRDSGFGKYNNSAYFEYNNKFFLIDCGYTVFNIIKDKFKFEEYEEINIIITHLHNDHAGSLSQFVLFLWFTLNKKAIIISKCSKIKEYLDITGVPEEAYIIEEKIDDFEFIKTKHSPYLDTYGFNIKINNKSIVFTSDTSTIEPFLPYIKNCNELYIDVSKSGGVHIKIDDVTKLLEEIKNCGTKVFLMHIDDLEYIKKVTKNNFFTE